MGGEIWLSDEKFQISEFHISKRFISYIFPKIILRWTKGPEQIFSVHGLSFDTSDVEEEALIYKPLDE